MSVQHTPGPWMVLPSVVESQFVVLTEHGTRQDIALTYGFESTPREANARLIAAAPDLLAALGIAAQFMSIASDWNIDEAEINGEMRSTYELLDVLRAAIAKATGSQP